MPCVDQFSSRTQEVVGVVEADRLTRSIKPFIPIGSGRPMGRLLFLGPFPPPGAKRRLTCFRSERRLRCGDWSVPDDSRGEVVQTESGTGSDNVSRKLREAGGSRLACGEQAAGTSDSIGC